jgi:hypothetical protein
MGALGLPVVLGDSFQSLFHVILPMWIGAAVSCVGLIAAVVAFVYAVRFRLRKRLLPSGLIVLELLFGIAGALVLFAFWGVLTYSAIG